MTPVDRIKITTELLLRHADLHHLPELLLLGEDAANDVVAEQALAAISKENIQAPSHVPRVELLSLTDVARDHQLLEGRRWALVCVIDPQLEVSVLTQLLASIRDLHADRVLHISDSASWSLADSLALGFCQLEAGESFNVYGFDIRTYKPVPNWLNSRHWANPEHWGKHRW